VQQTGVSVPGIVTYDRLNRIGLFKANDVLLPSTSYVATITTGAANLQGAHMAANYQFTFTTRATTDTSPLKVVSTNPANGATCVSQNIIIQITFNEGADPTTVNTDTIRVMGPGGSVRGVVSYNPVTLTASFGAATLTPNSTFAVTVSGVTDLAGVEMTAPFTFSFSVGLCGIASCPLTYTAFDAPSGATQALGINDAGAVVGTSIADGSGFLFADGKFTTINFPGATATRPSDINDSGVITGEYDNSSGTHGFVLANGSFTNFDYPSSTATFPKGINKSGTIVGQAQVNNNPVAFVRFTDGMFMTFQGSTSLRGINDGGDIIGFATTGGGSFLFKNGTFISLDAGSVIGTEAEGINDQDQIVGPYHPGGAVLSFMKSGSTYCAVQVPNSVETQAQDINDSGVIVGFFEELQTSRTRGFLAKPTSP
jgi:Bacterial Ig-like domain